MPLPTSQFMQNARAAADAWATSDTPFILDEWYVAALASELGTTPLKRTLLGRDIALFRTEQGTVAALDDRCAHRSYPLSLGKVEGDSLVCGYHGIRYDVRGGVIEVPSQPRAPSGIGVRAYPIHERGPLVWIWMGDPAQADASRIPGRDWMYGDGWVTKAGYMHMNANYVSLHENLLDLTHLSYLHAKSFGTPDYAKAPFDVQIHPGRYTLTRHVVPTKLPRIWAESTGLREEGAARIATSEYLAPGVHETTATFYDSRLPETGRVEFTAKAAHLPTPETSTSTHYFVVDGRSFATEDAAITDFMHEQLFVAFREDVVGLEALQQTLLNSGQGASFYEFSLISDRASIEMRKHLKQRAEAQDHLR